MPSDPTGVRGVFAVFVTPDGRHYVYSARRTITDLNLVEGLK